eukprot:jgi/Chlat1/817/Chrsp104S01314
MQGRDGGGGGGSGGGGGGRESAVLWSSSQDLRSAPRASLAEFDYDQRWPTNMHKEMKTLVRVCHDRMQELKTQPQVFAFGFAMAMLGDRN